MKAIIISDSDARALINELKLNKFNETRRGTLTERHGQAVVEAMVDSIHSEFHYIVTRWLQEQGADCLRK